MQLKFIYSEKATKFCKSFTLLLSYVEPVKSKMKISQNFVAFSEYMNFTYHHLTHRGRVSTNALAGKADIVLGYLQL